MDEMEALYRNITKYLLQRLTPEEIESVTSDFDPEFKNKTLISLSYSNTTDLQENIEEIRKNIFEFIKLHDPNISYYETGSSGDLSYEPILNIKIPGKKKIAISGVYPDNVVSLIESIFNKIASPGHCYFQYAQSSGEWWRDVHTDENIPSRMHQNRVLLDLCGRVNPESLAHYVILGGYKTLSQTLKTKTSKEVLSTIKDSKLRGRSGSGFPAANKWELASQVRSDTRYFICNAFESDPGAFSVKLLCESNPHSIIEGLILASYAIHATKAYIFICNEHVTAIHRLQHAINECKEAGILGRNILESQFNLEIIIKINPRAYVCGEETAMIKCMEGKRGMPEPKPPYPTEKGLFGKPTVINNAETLAWIPHILDKGIEWFQKMGTENNYGTKLLAISGQVKNCMVAEVNLGTQFSEIFYEIAGGTPENSQLKAFQTGGPAGSLFTANDLSLPADFDTLKKHKSSIGSGGLVFYDYATCMVDLVKHNINFLSSESCGKCIPCREGTRTLLSILQQLTTRPEPQKGAEALERFKGIIQIENISNILKQTSLCGLGQNAPNLLSSLLHNFKSELEEHLFERKCKAAKCTGLRLFTIDVEACTGCNACAKKCPVNAILGVPRYSYFIVQDKCISCGLCHDACKFNAVIVK